MNFNCGYAQCKYNSHDGSVNIYSFFKIPCDYCYSLFYCSAFCKAQDWFVFFT